MSEQHEQHEQVQRALVNARQAADDLERLIDIHSADEKWASVQRLAGVMVSIVATIRALEALDGD